MRKEKGAPITSAPITTDGKVNAFSGQLQTIRQIFLTPMSMLMASFATGILRANICRYGQNSYFFQKTASNTI